MSKITDLIDFKKYQKQVKEEVRQQKEEEDQIIVGMGTCGIAAGAREVVEAITQELKNQGLTHVNVTKTGCIGMCEQEVLVDIKRKHDIRVTYGSVTPEDVPRLIESHLIKGEIDKELVVGKPGKLS